MPNPQVQLQQHWPALCDAQTVSLSQPAAAVDAHQGRPAHSCRRTKPARRLPAQMSTWDWGRALHSQNDVISIVTIRHDVAHHGLPQVFVIVTFEKRCHHRQPQALRTNCGQRMPSQSLGRSVHPAHDCGSFGRRHIAMPRNQCAHAILVTQPLPSLVIYYPDGIQLIDQRSHRHTEVLHQRNNGSLADLPLPCPEPLKNRANAPLRHQ